MRFLIIFIFLVTNVVAKELPDIKNIVIHKVPKTHDNVIFLNKKDQKININEYKGNLLVLNFWYIACGPCIVEMPYLNQLVEKYKNENVQFLALSFDSIPDIKNFLSRTEFNYIQGSIDRNFMYDFTPVSPGHFIVDKNGIIRDILIGAPRNTEEIYGKLISVIEKNKK